MPGFGPLTDLMNGLRKDGVLTGPPFSQPIDFVYFDLWHYDGRTSKHGAFMGGADFVQWHGNYPMLQKTGRACSRWPPNSGDCMVEGSERWWARPQMWVEAFVTLNVAFLSFDIYLAHSVNQFRNQAEYIPLLFSISAPLVLVVALAVRYRWPAVWKDLGYLAGWIAVLIGLTGVDPPSRKPFFL